MPDLGIFIADEPIRAEMWISCTRLYDVLGNIHYHVPTLHVLSDTVTWLSDMVVCVGALVVEL